MKTRLIIISLIATIIGVSYIFIIPKMLYQPTVNLLLSQSHSALSISSIHELAFSASAVFVICGILTVLWCILRAVFEYRNEVNKSKHQVSDNTQKAK